MTCFPANGPLLALIYFGSSGAVSLTSYGLGYLAKSYDYHVLGNSFYVFTGLVALPAGLMLVGHIIGSFSSKSRR